jgi:RND family efflux transporter MFP subunit
MMAQTGREHLKIVDLFTIHIEVGVIESELPLVREGSKAEVRFPALDGRQFTGTVHTVSPLVDDESRTARVTIAIPNPDGVVKSGMFANVEIVTEEIVDALVVPRDAVLARDQRELIFRIENNTAKWHYVSTGRKNRDYVQILDGISAGDTIAVGGHYTLAHDARVTVR